MNTQKLQQLSIHTILRHTTVIIFLGRLPSKISWKLEPAKLTTEFLLVVNKNSSENKSWFSMGKSTLKNKEDVEGADISKKLKQKKF